MRGTPPASDPTVIPQADVAVDAAIQPIAKTMGLLAGPPGGPSIMPARDGEYSPQARTRAALGLPRLLFWLLLCALGGLPTGCAGPARHPASSPPADTSKLRASVASLVDFSLTALIDVDADTRGDWLASHGVAVLPFTTDGQPSALGEHLARQIETALAEVLWVRDIDNLALVSRRHIDDLLREQSLTMSDAFAQGPAEVLGRLRGADLLITGELAEAGQSTDLTLQILRVPDGRVLRGRVMSLPISMPAFADALEHTPPVAAGSEVELSSHGPETLAPPGENLLSAITDTGLVLLDPRGVPSSDIGVILTVGNPSSEAGADLGPEADSLAGRLGQPDRRPLDLCLVLDISASMNTEGRIAYARFAANQIVDGLQPNDRFCLITFSRRASVAMSMTTSSERAKRDAHGIIDSLRPVGKTNFESALREVRHMASRHDGTAMTHYVVFISDGKPTEGMQDPELLGSMAADVAAQGVSVHTVGVSQDIRFDVLSQIANQGAGRMHVLDDPTSLAAFVPYLVNSGANCLADQAQLEFRPADDLELELKSAGWRQDPDGLLRANLGLICRGEAVVRLLHLKPDAARALRPGQNLRVGEARLSYVTPDGQHVVERSELHIGTTDDDQRFAASARLETLLESHLLGLRQELMSVHDLLTEQQPAQAADYLHEVLEHVDLVLANQPDPLDILAPLRRLAERARDYAQVLSRDPQDATMRSMLYRDACGRPDDRMGPGL